MPVPWVYPGTWVDPGYWSDRSRLVACEEPPEEPIYSSGPEPLHLAVLNMIFHLLTMADGFFIVMTPIGGEIRSLSQDSDLKHGAEQPIRQAGNADTTHISMAMLRQVTDAEHESACKRLKAQRRGGLMAHLGMCVKSCGTGMLRKVALTRPCSMGWGNINRTINMITLSGKMKKFRSWIAAKTARA